MPVVGENNRNINSGGGSGEEPSFWGVSGNNVLPADPYIGTNDNSDFIIKTNAESRIIVTKDGRFGVGEVNPQALMHLKAYSDHDGTGLKIDNFILETEDEDFNIIYSYAVPLGSVNLITITFVGREGSTKRCSFRRTLMVTRDGGIALVANNVWQSDFTFKSETDFDVAFEVFMNTIHFKVKNSTGLTTMWNGHIEIDTIL